MTFEPVAPISRRAASVALSTPPPAIRVRHCWHRFSNIEVLRDVTFDVGAGEIFGFIGPNGAGKTTTIRVMSTLLEPMAGRVEIYGIDVTIDPHEVRRRIGYMADQAGVYDRITVREYLEFFADAFQVPSLGVVDAVLELTDLDRIQDRVVATMSKGMKQRLQLGRVLLHDPKVLILDEPASDLDPRARIEIRDLLLELQSLGKTIFLSSHILTELADVCTSIAILERGRLVVAGPIHSIAARLQAVRAADAASAAVAGNATPRSPAEAPMQAFGPPRTFGDAPLAGAPATALPATAQPAHAAPDGSWAADGATAHATAPQAYAPPTIDVRRRLKVRVLGDPAIAARLVHGGPGIVDVSVAGGLLLVTFVGDDVKIAEVVQHLVSNRVGVVGVEPERNELERIFLEVTNREGT